MSWVYWAPKSRIRILSCTSFRPVVGSFLHDLHVVNVGFAHPRGGDLDELRPGAQLIHRRAAGVAHAGANAVEKLLDHRDRASLVRDATLDAFGHQLVDVHLRILEIAV